MFSRQDRLETLSNNTPFKGNLEILRNIVDFHHEAVDGNGYPDGLRTHHIPLETRIIDVPDMFESLTSRRPYKSAWSNREAIS
jgi:two-component system response regulator RpfG